ncbi:MAG: bifunctional 23S rRNA (guanine(2069)-N(7))-methyltransferase RlmK/23S rRNA (guanine(2445)-N(2))-methyltransferase RlmL [Pseudomonadota bacterium]
MSESLNNYFASCPRGSEQLLAVELHGLGASTVNETTGGVRFSGELTVAYRACLWSRLASRVLLPLHSFPLVDTDSLYAAAQTLDWPDIFAGTSTFAIEVAGRSPAISHTHFAALRIKDAVADRFREKSGERPDVNTDAPDIRIHLHLHGDNATLSLDLAGDSLHRRGYRQDGAEAPLKENLACALLVRAGWPEVAAAGGALMDPMCGSGTLVIEAALLAADIAPGLSRPRYGFEAWLDHKPKIWQDLLSEARARKDAGLKKPLPVFVGQDIHPGALKAARTNAAHAGLSAHIEFKQVDISDAQPPTETPGLLIVNPPYGERLGDEAEIIKLYSLLGTTLKQRFAGWRAAVFTARPDLSPRIGLRAESLHSFYNGALPCKLLRFEIPTQTMASGGEDFANRLGKNLKHLTKWAKRSGVSCYRVYDGDLPDYAVAVDIYDGTGRHVHVQEYAAPKTIDPVKAERRLREALSVIQRTLEVTASQIHFRIRKPMRGTQQYQRQNEAGRFHEIDEHGCRLLVNFEDYLDTGIFLDHRPLRLRIQREAKGKRFLNLFCYTASASAHAALGGATQTVSVDMSNTYLEWGERNLRLNGIRPQLMERPEPGSLPRHALLRADCRDWLSQQSKNSVALQFDLILLDPPTFSNSKRMEGTLDLQRDHVQLINDTAALLAPGGVLYFSTNRRGFKLDQAALTGLSAQDITKQTLDEDFKRPPPSHKCWRIQHA